MSDHTSVSLLSIGGIPAGNRYSISSDGPVAVVTTHTHT